MPQFPRPITPAQVPTRPQFQPGGPVTSPPSFTPQSSNPGPRGTIAYPNPGTQQIRSTTPTLRSFGPQSITPQQVIRPQSPALTHPPQRPAPPNNLQFGPRQPPTGVTTPDGTKFQIQSSNGTIKNGVSSYPAQLPRQSSQSSLKDLDQFKSNQNKPVNLDNQTDNKNEIQGKAENGIDIPALAKGRSYSIAAAPGAPSPLKGEDDRRKSVSVIGGRIDEIACRSPGLGLIQEGKIESKDNVRGSKESVRSETSNESGKDVLERPESRLSGSKMTESLMGSLTNIVAQKKSNDEAITTQKNVITEIKIAAEESKTLSKAELSDRSPSLTRSDDSPEPKTQNNTQSPVPPKKSESTTPETERPKTPKTELKPEVKLDANNSAPKTVTTLNNTIAKSPIPEVKTPTMVKKPSELITSLSASEVKKTTPRKTASAPVARPKGNFYK